MNIAIGMDKYNLYRPIIKVKINQHIVKAIIDTGAVNLLWVGVEDEWDKLSINTVKHKSEQKVFVGGLGGNGSYEDAYKVKLFMYGVGLDGRPAGIQFDNMLIADTKKGYTEFQVLIPYCIFDKFNVSIEHHPEQNYTVRRDIFRIDTKINHIRYNMSYSGGMLSEISLMQDSPNDIKDVSKEIDNNTGKIKSTNRLALEVYKSLNIDLQEELEKDKIPQNDILEKGKIIDWKESEHQYDRKTGRNYWKEVDVIEYYNHLYIVTLLNWEKSRNGRLKKGNECIEIKDLGEL